MNKYHILRGLAILLLLLNLAGCENKKEATLFSGVTETPAAEALKKPFVDAMEPLTYELPSQALENWRQFAKFQPALVLYSNDPFLTPVAEDRRKEIHQLLAKGTMNDFEKHAALMRSNPWLLPAETVSTAIDNRIISELYLVLPNRDPIEKLSAEVFGQSAMGAGLITQAEADDLTLVDGIISGTVRGIPFHVIHPSLAAKITKPVILHVDLGYFKGMYVNEIKTPLYDLLYALTETVIASGYPVLSATFSFSNQEANFSLESRFIVRDLAETLRHPDYLTAKAPASWTLRAQALKATAMMSESLARELTFKSLQSNPEDAATHYAFALDLFEQSSNDLAFEALDNAVKLDKGYGLEYLSLAEAGLSNGKIEKSISLLKKAADLFPNNPSIRVELASRLIETGQTKEARPILAELRDLEWSEIFYPNISEALKEMTAAASVDAVLPTTTTEALSEKPEPVAPKFNHMGMDIQGK